MVNINDFQYDRRGDEYISKIEINGILVEISVSDYHIKDIKVLNDRLEKDINWFKINYKKILDYCADNLLDDVELEDEEETITKEEFKNKLELESLRIWPDGDLEISFRDGDLFGGHWLILYTDSEYQFDGDVEIAG